MTSSINSPAHRDIARSIESPRRTSPSRLGSPSSSGSTPAIGHKRDGDEFSVNASSAGEQQPQSSGSGRSTLRHSPHLGVSSTPSSFTENRDVESSLPLRGCPSKILEFLNNLSVVDEIRRFDDAEFFQRLRNELTTDTVTAEQKPLLAALSDKVGELRRLLNVEGATPEEKKVLADAKRYLEPIMNNFLKDINTLRHGSSAAKRMLQGALTLLLYPLPLAVVFTQKTGAYKVFNLASYTYTAIQLISLIRRPTTEGQLYKRHVINRHSLVFFISSFYAIPTFYKKAQFLQKNVGFIAAASVAQATFMLYLRYGQEMIESYKLRFNNAFSSGHELSSGFAEAVGGVLQDMRANLEKIDGFLSDFQKEKRITGHTDRQLTFFKENMAKVITGLEKLLETGSGGNTNATAEGGQGFLERVRQKLASSFQHNPALKGKLALALVGFSILGSNIALMRNDGLALPDFIADAIVSGTFMLHEALNPHVSLKGMNGTVRDTVGGMTIGIPFAAAAQMSHYMDDPKKDPVGFATGTVCYTATYLLFGGLAGDLLAKGLMAAGGVLSKGQQIAIGLGRSALSAGFKMFSAQPQHPGNEPGASDEIEVPTRSDLLAQPLTFSRPQLASAESHLIEIIEQLDTEGIPEEEWHDAKEHLEASPAVHGSV